LLSARNLAAALAGLGSAEDAEPLARRSLDGLKLLRGDDPELL